VTQNEKQMFLKIIQEIDGWDKPRGTGAQPEKQERVPFPNPSPCDAFCLERRGVSRRARPAKDGEVQEGFKPSCKKLEKPENA